MESSHTSNIEEFDEDLEGEEEDDNQIEEEEEEDENDQGEESEEEIEEEEEEDHEYGEAGKSNYTNHYNINVDHSSENGAATSGTLGLYSSFDTMIGGNNESSDQSYYDSNPKVDEQLISSHLKGALSFGLPRKGSTLRIHKPYRMVKKKSLFHHRKKPSQTLRGIGSVNSSKSDQRKKIEKEMQWDNIEHLDENLKVAYRIVMELMGDSLKAYNSIFMETIEMDPSVNGDYLEVVKEPVWLPKIKEKLVKGEYNTITEVFSQLRLMMENAYKYFGANHSFARRGIKLESLMEQKLALLRKELRDLCSLEATHGIAEKDIREAKRTKGCCITLAGERYFSYLLYKERGSRLAREKELKKKRLDHMRRAKILKENEILQWDSNLLEGPLGGPIKHMWELVQINQFVFLSIKVLNISQISQYEMERFFMIPEASITLRMLMTSLVSSPLQRLKLSEKPYMPYSVWARRLANKTFHWYRIYSRESHNPMKLFEQLGIEPKFWSVCGEKNPFSKKLFHEMTLYQRVWLVKTLCDYISHTHKSVQEAIAEQPEENMREILLGKDSNGNEYIYFPHLNSSDLRVYRRSQEKHQTIFEEEDEKDNENKSKLFSKDQVKAFKKLIKKLKKNREKDEDWEYEQRKLKNRLPKKRGRKPLVGSSHISTPPEKRSRPERLRQTPKPRYDLLAIESCLDDGDDDDLISFTSRKSSKKNIPETESEDEEEDESEEEDDSKSEGIENLKEKSTKKKNSSSICKTCGKTFRSKSAMYGHTAMHVRKKEKKLDSESNTEINEEKNNKDDIQTTETEEKCPEPKEEKPDLETLLERKENEDGIIKAENSNDPHKSDEKDAKIPHFPEDKKDALTSDSNRPLKEEYDSECTVKKVVSNSVEESKASPSFSENKKEEIFSENKVGKENITDETSSPTNESEDIADDNSLLKCADTKSGDIQSRSTSPDDVGDNGSSVGMSTPDEPDLKNLTGEPDVDNFELVAASFLELRDLILKFGSLPSKYKREKKESLERKSESEENEEDEEVDEEDVDCDEAEDMADNANENANQMENESKRPKCEQKLHQALCKLLHQLGASELKLNSLHKQLRKKIWGEYLDWHNRESSYVDPAEEVWKSDTEPEPTPSATQTPKPSSSSSSSEESYNEDGTRKRKLRKRRVKRLPPADPPSPPSAPVSRATSPVNPTVEDSIAVSSRGRIRKVKRIVNYDRLDFDKLAQEAEEEAEKEKERKKKKKEEDTSRERALHEAAQSLHIPSSGVRRYIISKEGEVVGYIGNDGQVHSGSVKPKEQEIRSRQLGQEEEEAGIKKINVPKPPEEMRNKTPKVVVSAVNQAGTLVYVRMVGIQALEMMKLIESSKNDPPRQIKLQRFSQTFTFYTNSYILTENIPGYPDSDTSDPQVLAKLSSTSINKSLNNLAKVSPKKAVTLASTISSPEVPACKPPNPVALAYQGIIVSTTSERETIKSPPSTSCASLSASTRLVFASPSAVPSVPPLTPTTSMRLPVSSASTSAPLLVQTENGQQLQVGLSSERLSQIVQKTGQRIVAVPNDKGGYTISLLSSANTHTNSNLKINKNATTYSQGIQGSPQKSVVTQLLPTAVSSTTPQPGSIIKGRLPQSLNTAVSSQQQIVTNCTVSSQVVSPSQVGRQVIIQHPNVNSSSSPKVVSSMTQPQQYLQFTQSPIVHQQQPQQQQFFQIQQPSQKIVQLVHTSGNRQVVQMIQPGQVLLSNNDINSSVSAIQQPSGAVVLQTPQGMKQANLLQPQVVVQSPQQTKILQVANSDQYSQQIQYDQSQVQPQQIIIQPQQYFIQQPQPQLQPQAQEVHQQSQLNTPTLVTNTTHLQSIKQEDNIKEELILKEEPLIDTPVEPQQQYLLQATSAQPATSVALVKSTQSQLTTNTLEQPLTQPFTLITKKPLSHNNLAKEQISTVQSNAPIKESTQQVGRIVLLQVNGVQKAFLQLPDGRLTLLSPEQLQPLISSGTIKLSS